MRTRASILVLLLALAPGCKPRSEPPAPAKPSRQTTTTQPKKKVDPCAEIIEAYARVLEKADLRCGVDGDCACYQGGLGPRAGCGGVANRETVTRLNALWEKFRAAGCRYTQHCAPWACTPRCHQGQCVQAATG